MFSWEGDIAVFSFELSTELNNLILHLIIYLIAEVKKLKARLKSILHSNQ